MSLFISFRRGSMTRALELSLLSVIAAPTAVADTFSPAYPYAVTSARGGYVFKMIPDTAESARFNETPSGSGAAYAVKPDGQLAEIWRTSGWYSQKVFLGTDGHTLVRMGPWHAGSAPSPNDLAIAFYRDGQLLKSYSTAELIKDRSKVAVSSSHYEWLAVMGSFAPGIRDDEFGLSLNEGDHSFTLTTIDDRRYRFNTDTGAIKAVEPTVRALMVWASPEDLERLIVAFAVTDFPIAREQEGALLGLPQRLVPMFDAVDDDFVTSFSAVTNPSNSTGYYAVRRKSKMPTPPRSIATAETLAIDLVFQAPSGTTFIVESDKFGAEELQRMKKDRKARNQTPKEFSEDYLKTHGIAGTSMIRLR